MCICKEYMNFSTFQWKKIYLLSVYFDFYFSLLILPQEIEYSCGKAILNAVWVQ